jgi:hypothetical protein
MDGSNDRGPNSFEKAGRSGRVVVAGLLLVSVAVVLLIYAMLR